MTTTGPYPELEIGLHRAHAGAYQVELRFTDPASEVEVPPERGTAALDLARLLALMGDTDAYGKALAGGLFHDDNVRGLYIRARTATVASGACLRLRLLVGPSAAELHALRWELLSDLESGAPLATSETTLFSRFMHSRNWRAVKLGAKADLRALVAVAAPAGLGSYRLAEVDVDGEVRRARESLSPAAGDGIDVEVIGHAEPLTLERLTAGLRGGNGQPGVDVLYLVCHGVLSTRQVPSLFFSDDDGNVARVDGKKLARAVAELRRPPRLVVLASCDSGAPPRSPQGDGAGTDGGTTTDGRATAEASLAPLLAAAGVSAILAMQGRISMQTIARAMPVFFRELLEDGQIDRALAVARGAVRDRHDAWMPALYLRLKRGCIWRQPKASGDREDDAGDGSVAETGSPEAVLTLKTWPPPELPEQPYPVLLPYTHPDLMAGREQEVEKLKMQLRLPVPILGLGAASGTGKTSLLLGGLVPALDASGAPVSIMRYPHERGVAGLLLGDLLEGVGNVEDGEWRTFVDQLAEVERLAGAPALLVLDQFENVLRPEATAARARLGPLLAATTRRRSGTDEPLCRWLLAYRIEYHGELLAWLEDVLLEAKSRPLLPDRESDPEPAESPPLEKGAGGDFSSLPYDLSGPDRFQSLTVTPLATPPAAGDALAEATRVFLAAIEKPLAHYDYRFRTGDAERLARAFAEARLALPRAPLVPELQVVLAHLLARAAGGVITVPADPGEPVEEALADHLRRALEAAFPTGAADSATRRARALLALRELATATGQRAEGVRAEELARAIGDDGERILEQLATPLTRLVVLQKAAGGLRYVLSHDRMAEVVVRMVEEEGRHGKLLVEAELLRLRRFVALKTALHRLPSASADDGSAGMASRIPRRHYRSIAEHAEALLWDDDRRAWWAACRQRRQADLRRTTALTAVVLVFLALVTWGTWSQVRQHREHQALLGQVAEGEPGVALLALDRLAEDGTAAQELLALLRGREVAMGVLELGLGEISEEGHRPLGGTEGERLSAVVLRTVELALPWARETPEDPVLIANLVSALDYAPGRDPTFAERAWALRDRVLAPLRELRPPPRLPARDDPDWIEISAGTFLMGSPEVEGGDEERPRHEVTVSAFRIQRHEVTNAEYRRLVPDHPGDDDLPAAFVSWYAATTYAAWLGGRLPTEAEWEVAARAGCSYPYCTRAGLEATVDDVAWTLQNSRDPETGELGPVPVMRLEPNPWGLYDMSGNLWEWTADGYAAYPAGPREDPWVPAASTSGGWRVLRGGGFRSVATRTRVASRLGNAPGNEDDDLGLRAVLPGRPERQAVDLGRSLAGLRRRAALLVAAFRFRNHHAEAQAPTADIRCLHPSTTRQYPLFGVPNGTTAESTSIGRGVRRSGRIPGGRLRIAARPGGVPFPDIPVDIPKPPGIRLKLHHRLH